MASLRWPVPSRLPGTVMGSFYLALTPWLVFAVADRSAGLGPYDAAFLACAVAVGVAANDRRLRRRRRLPVMAALFFLAFAVTAVVTGVPGPSTHYDRAAVTAALGVYLLGSVRRTPTTLVYALDIVPPRRAGTTSFRSHHAKLTLRWSLAVAAMAASLAMGDLVDTRVAETVCNWLVPMVVIVAAAAWSSPTEPQALDEVSSVLAMLDGFVSRAVGEPLNEAQDPSTPIPLPRGPASVHVLRPRTDHPTFGAKRPRRFPAP